MHLGSEKSPPLSAVGVLMTPSSLSFLLTCVCAETLCTLRNMLSVDVGIPSSMFSHHISQGRSLLNIEQAVSSRLPHQQALETCLFPPLVPGYSYAPTPSCLWKCYGFEPRSSGFHKYFIHQTVLPVSHDVVLLAG